MAGGAGKLTASLSRPLLPPQDDAGISLWHPADVPAAGKGLLDCRPAMKLASGGSSDRNGCFGRARHRRCRQRSIAEQPHSEPAWPMHAEISMKRILSLLLPALLALSILACTAVQAEPGSVRSSAKLSSCSATCVPAMDLRRSSGLLTRICRQRPWCAPGRSPACSAMRGQTDSPSNPPWARRTSRTADSERTSLPAPGWTQPAPPAGGSTRRDTAATC